MNINCLLLTKDIVLEHTLKNYISKTPFFNVINEKDIDEKSSIDIIFMEYCLERYYVSKYLSRLYDKPCIIISNKKAPQNNLLRYPNFTTLPKKFTHEMLILALGNIIDNSPYKNTH